MDNTSMIHQYWDFMSDLRFQIIYCEKYEHRLQKINLFVEISAYLLTGIAIILWALFDTQIIIWTTMIAVGQLIQILKPMLPFEKREIALRYYLPELRKLAVESEARWNSIPLLNFNDLIDSLKSDKARYIALESNYIGSITIPCVKKLDPVAIEELKNYMKSFDPISQEGDESNAKENPDSE